MTKRQTNLLAVNLRRCDAFVATLREEERERALGSEIGAFVAAVLAKPRGASPASLLKLRARFS